MLRDFDNFFTQQEEPVKGCLLALRKIIKDYNEHITEAWKYRMPCFCYKGKQFCYLWTDKDTGNPYILVVDGNKIEHPALEQGSRSRMKIFPINPNKYIPVETIYEVFDLVMQTVYK